MQLICERLNISNAFIIRLRTRCQASVEAFEELMMQLSEPVMVISKKACNTGGNQEVLYLLDMERLKLAEIKKQIDEQVTYDSLELFEFMHW